MTKSSALKKIAPAVPEKSITLNGSPLCATVIPVTPQPFASTLMTGGILARAHPHAPHPAARKSFPKTR